jgi:ABC-type nitrate/sulfonate/bicarbonate transport system permease component
VSRPPGLVTAGCSLVVLALLTLAWQLTIWIGHVPPYNLPSVGRTVTAMSHHVSGLLSRGLSTAEGALAGLAASVLVALVLALAVARWPALGRPVTTYALVIRTLPIVGVAPLITLIAGRGLTTSILCVGIVTVFTLYVAAVEGLRTVPGPVNDLADLYGAPFARRVWRAWLPSAWGGLIVGLRIASPLAVLAAILAEWLSGRRGIGSLMTSAQADRDVPLLWAATVSAALLGLLAYAIPGLLAGVAARRGLSDGLEES